MMKGGWLLIQLQIFKMRAACSTIKILRYLYRTNAQSRALGRIAQKTEIYLIKYMVDFHFIKEKRLKIYLPIIAVAIKS